MVHDLLAVRRAPEVVSVDLAVGTARARLYEQVVLEVLQHQRLQADGERPDFVPVAREVEGCAPLEVGALNGNAGELQLLPRVGHDAGVDDDVRRAGAGGDRERDDLIDVALMVERAIEVPALAEEAHLEPDLGLELALGTAGEWWDRRGEAVQGDSAVPGGEAVDVVGEVARRAAPHLRVVQPELARGDLRREPERVAEHETRAHGRIEIGIARWRER